MGKSQLRNKNYKREANENCRTENKINKMKIH